MTAGLIAAALASEVAQAGSTPTGFVPEQVFVGRSEGTGTMQLGLGKQRPFTVASLGTTGQDGSLRLDQDVRFEGKPNQSRAWVMKQTAPGHYSATLSEAAGPVQIRKEGNRLRLRYALNHWGLVMHQTLDLSEDGGTVLNYGSIRFLGIPVGTIRETIRLKH